MNQPDRIARSVPQQRFSSPAIQEIRVLSFRAGGAAPADSPLRAAFADAWNARMSRTPHANFSMSLDYLAWQARHGESARAVLLDDEDRRGAMVLRECGSEVVSGLPWRWQIAIEGAEPRSPHGMTREDAGWFFAQAQRFAEGRRLRFYAPHPPGSNIEYPAARTVLIDLAHFSEPELLAALKRSRRSLVRRSERQGFRVIEAPSPEQQQAFDAVVRENHVRRHGIDPGARPLIGPPEFEWAQPWHWLLIALQKDTVAAGLGMGRIGGGMVDGRASGATEEAMKAGANSHVWWEAIRRARLAGYAWMNFGGSTTFKRHFGGTLVTIHCALGGSRRWFGPNMMEKLRADGIAFAVRTRRRMLATGATPRAVEPVPGS